MQAENIGQRDTVVTVRELAKASLSDDLKLAVAEALAATRPHSKVVVLSGQASSFVCPAALQPLIAGVVDKTSAFGQLTQVLERCLPHSTEPLTPRQEEIYGLIGQGLTNKEIARATELSVATVETHRKAIAQKLGMSGSELVRQASLRSRLNAVEG